MTPTRSSQGRLGALALLLLAALAPVGVPLAWAQSGTSASPGNPVLPYVFLLLGFVVLWVLFYKALYPFLLRYYRDRTSKSFFWELFLLYSLTWLHLSLYTLFTVGFEHAWIQWIAGFLAVLFLIWFAITFSRRRSA